MSEIISRELLSEVLGVISEIYEIKIVNDILFWNNGYINEINIHELAFKCKEKAREYGYSITTGNRVDGTDRYDVLCIHKDEDIEDHEAVFLNEIIDTEPNGCFLAMQWILDNKEK